MAILDGMTDEAFADRVREQQISFSGERLITFGEFCKQIAETLPSGDYRPENMTERARHPVCPMNKLYDAYDHDLDLGASYLFDGTTFVWEYFQAGETGRGKSLPEAIANL
jgi:hypothetical protein